MNILIFAGGSGTRLWPASRKSKPKQLLKLIGNKTLLQNTFERCQQWADNKQIYVATLSEYYETVRKQLPGIPASHYSLEPALRDRGPAIALAALIMNHQDPDSVFMTMWSDHNISEQPGYFKKLLTNAEMFLRDNPEATLTIGVPPTFAHTGFGYIKKGKKIENKYKLPLYKAVTFTEKPNEKTAERFVKSGQQLWNSGYFIWKTSTLLDLYKQHLPEVYKILEKIKPHLGTKNQQKAIDQWYPKMPKVEVENGIVEKVKDNLYTIEAKFDWIDVGSWKVIKDVQSKNVENITQGLHIDHNSNNSLVYNYNPNQLVTTLSTKDLIVVVTEDAILVADKDSSVDLKKLTAKLKEDKKLNKYL
jgi:mannose-1-phosphate guanylyltransferase